MCIWATLYHHTVPAVFAGFFFALTLCSFLWGRLALRGLGYSIAVPKSGIFPGQNITITRTVHNGKLLPLLWLELLEPCAPNGCLLPDSKLIVTNPSIPEDRPDDIWRCQYSFSLLKWHQTLTFSDIWQAERRGIHRVGEVTIRSGDGFGLCAASNTIMLPAARYVVVYPRLTDVSIEAILNDMWDSRSRSQGRLEDITLLKSIRNYTPRDPARRINQRLLARGQGLKVNQYEQVTPSDVLFMLDVASFAGADAEHLECVLSILASLITGLSRRGINVGLVAPRSAYFPQTYSRPSSGEGELVSMLELLSAASASDAAIDTTMEYISPELLGQTYYVALSEKAATSLQALAGFPAHKTQLLVLEAQGSVSTISQGLRARLITQFWRAS